MLLRDARSMGMYEGEAQRSPVAIPARELGNSLGQESACGDGAVRQMGNQFIELAKIFLDGSTRVFARVLVSAFMSGRHACS